ncbi:hypothetical protein DL96DRAFT_730817 [Flagelloscypha sp. PMI_526]|nr:hypothetical protein DL96DRAFT_730817 [Flagelloscypha sp. PMI_526]
MKSIDPNTALLDLIKPGIGPVGYIQQINETYASVITAQIDLTDPDNQRYLNHVVVVLLSLQRPVSRSVLSDLFDGVDYLPFTVIHSVLNALHPLLLGVDNDDPVEFIHLSLRDFFQDSPTFGALVQRVSAPRDFAKGHFFLLERSLYILQTQLQDAQIVYEAEDGSIPNNQLNNTRTSGALLYSANTWTHHVTRASTNEGCMFDMFDPFLAGSFAKWLEFHICFGSFLFSSEFVECIQNVHRGLYERFCSIIKHRSVAHALERISIRLLLSRRFLDAEVAGSQAVLSWGLKAAKIETNRQLSLALRALARAQQYFLRVPALTASEKSLQVPSNLVAEQPGIQAETFEASQQSVELYYELEGDRPALFNGYVAQALNSLSIRFTAAGKRQEAFKASQQLVELYRELAAVQPDLFNGDLALGLTNLSIHFTAIGKGKQALKASQQSVKLYRELAAKEPAVFNGHLAHALTMLSDALSGIGKRDEAFETIQQSVDLYRRLAAEKPVIFDSDLALALNTLSGHHYQCNQFLEAYQVSHSSLLLFRNVVAASDQCDSRLVNGLVHFAKVAWLLQDHVMAVDLLEESISLYKGLAKEQPRKFWTKLTAASKLQAEWKREGTGICLRQKRVIDCRESLVRRMPHS